MLRLRRRRRVHARLGPHVGRRRPVAREGQVLPSGARPEAHAVEDDLSLFNMDFAAVDEALRLHLAHERFMTDVEPASRRWATATAQPKKPMVSSGRRKLPCTSAWAGGSSGRMTPRCIGPQRGAARVMLGSRCPVAPSTTGRWRSPWRPISSRASIGSVLVMPSPPRPRSVPGSRPRGGAVATGTRPGRRPRSGR